MQLKFHMRCLNQFKMREWISVCARCRSFRGPIRIYCEDCWLRIFDFQNSQNELCQSNYPFKVYSLFTWHDEYDHLIRPLIYALKGGQICDPWIHLASKFLFLRNQTSLNSAEIIVTPPQEKNGDHAFFWAKALVNQIGAELHLCLAEEKRAEKQKSLSRARRHKREYVLKESYPVEPYQSKRVVFVDDTITSGGTAQAAFNALECPAQFEVWTLVARPRFGTQ